MKTKSLFGVQFAENQLLKDQVLGHFMEWKTKQFEESLEDRDDLVSMVELFGLSEKEKREAFRTAVDLKTAPDFSKMKDFLREDKCKHYFITQSVLDMCGKIRVKEPFDTEWLSPVPDGKRQLNFDNRLIRYEKVGSKIHAACVQRDATGYIQYTFFHMDTAQKDISKPNTYDDYEVPDQRQKQSLNFDATFRKLFFQLITFMELADVQEVTLGPGKSHGNKKSQDKLVNETRFPITIVNTSWNKIINREGFDVNGHYRKQACGPNLSERKLTWIDAYHKNGINLSSEKGKKAIDEGKKPDIPMDEHTDEHRQTPRRRR